jgi:hypothetical protein
VFWGDGKQQPPLHLAIGSWDRGQEGPICHLLVLPATLSTLGRGGGWGQLSGWGLLTEMGVGATLGGWEAGLFVFF